MEDGSCCGKFIASILGALYAALLLFMDLSTTYGEGVGEATTAMFPDTPQVYAVIVYILMLLVYPFLSERAGLVASLVAFGAAGYTAAGVAGWLVVFPLVSGIMAVFYIMPACLVLMLSILEISAELRANKLVE